MWLIITLETWLVYKLCIMYAQLLRLQVHEKNMFSSYIIPDIFVKSACSYQLHLLVSGYND